MVEHSDEAVIPNPETENRWDVFYPGIENNMVFVHGTSSTGNRDWIIENGLKAPSASSASEDTLARNVQFSTFHRYSGGPDGHILVFRLEDSDLKYGYKPYSRQRAFAIGYSGVIQPNKIELIIPKKESRVYDELQNEYRLAIKESEALDAEQAVKEIKEISERYVEIFSNNLTAHGNFVNGDRTKEEIIKLAQELVWNQLNDTVVCTIGDIDYYSQEFMRLGSEAFAQKINKPGGWDDADLNKIKRQFERLERLHKESGSGLENITLSERMILKRATKLVEWIDGKEQGANNGVKGESTRKTSWLHKIFRSRSR